MGIKLFASDLDGTLLRSDHRISEKSAAVIRRAQASGKIFLAVTGRAWNSAAPILKNAGISCGAVLLNGAEYRNAAGGVVLREYIDPPSAAEVLRVLSANDIDFEIHAGCGDFVTNPGLDAAARIFKPEALPIIAASGILKFYIEYHNIRIPRNANQEVFSFSNCAPRDNSITDLLPGLPQGLQITSSAPWNLEITAKAATKARMLAKTVHMPGISEEETAVFGDGENDIPMLKYFRHSYAMGNAAEIVKKNAAAVIGTNDQDSVAIQMEEIMRHDDR